MSGTYLDGWVNPYVGYGAPGPTAKPNAGEEEERNRKKLLADQAAAAGGFADTGQQGFGQLGNDARARMDYLRNVANGGQSIAAEQLRQGTQSLQSQQRSMAASASPRDAGAASHSAMMNSARLGYGMSGQASLAGLQERRDAESALAQLINAQRQMELNAALGSRQTAVSGYGTGNVGAPEKGWLEKYGPLIVGGAGAIGGSKGLAG